MGEFLDCWIGILLNNYSEVIFQLSPLSHMNFEFDYTSLMLGLCLYGLMYFISHFFLLSLQVLVFHLVGTTSFISSHNLVELLT